MELTPLLLSRIQFAFTVSFHIIFPAFTVGLAAWLCWLEAWSLGTGRPVYRRLFDFWLRVFGLAFGLGVVSGIVMAFDSAPIGASCRGARARSRARCWAMRASPPLPSRPPSSACWSSGASWRPAGSTCWPA
jgi:hypothetical protein